MAERGYYLQAANDGFQPTTVARPTLQFGGGGGNSTGMDVVDAKIAAAEARTDTKFAQVMTELRLIEQATKGLKATIIVTGLAVLGVTIAVFAFGASQFGNGVMVTSVAVQDAQQALELSKQTAENLERLRVEVERGNDQFDSFIDTLKTMPGWQQLQVKPEPGNGG